ncbi:MAG: glycosyltransferase, partial [Christensenella sp.]
KGWVDKKYIPYILSKSDLNLVHSKASEMGRFGTSNNKLFDYFASGKPILMDVVLQNYNIIEEYGAGICTENQNAQTIADAVIEIYNMPKEKREIMGKNARRAAQDFDYKNLAQKLEKIIEELL